MYKRQDTLQPARLVASRGRPHQAPTPKAVLSPVCLNYSFKKEHVDCPAFPFPTPSKTLVSSSFSDARHKNNVNSVGKTSFSRAVGSSGAGELRIHLRANVKRKTRHTQIKKNVQQRAPHVCTSLLESKKSACRTLKKITRTGSKSTDYRNTNAPPCIT